MKKTKAESTPSPAFQAAQSWYQMEVANYSFEAVRDGLQIILKGKLNENSPEYYAMMLGLVCIYARPFTHNRPVGKLSYEIVPKELKDLHDSIITFRHQLFAHVDATAIVGEGQYPNEVVIENDGKRISILIDRSAVRPAGLERMRPLVEALIKKTNYYRSKYAKYFEKPVRKLGKGEFRINVTDPSAPIFIKLSEAESLARVKRRSAFDPKSA